MLGLHRLARVSPSGLRDYVVKVTGPDRASAPDINRRTESRRQRAPHSRHVRYVRVRAPGRPRHGNEAGLTLIEMLVAIALISVGVVGIVAGIASAERSAGINQEQAKLETSMRQLSDFVRSQCWQSSDPSCARSLLYQPCATASTYQGAVNSYLATLQLTGVDAGLSWTVANVNESTSAVHTNQPSPQAVQACGSIGGVTVSDFGVQEITLRVSSTRRSLARVVWKADT